MRKFKGIGFHKNYPQATVPDSEGHLSEANESCRLKRRLHKLLSTLQQGKSSHRILNLSGSDVSLPPSTFFGRSAEDATSNDTLMAEGETAWSDFTIAITDVIPEFASTEIAMLLALAAICIVASKTRKKRALPS
jgi:hypothetical protein